MSLSWKVTIASRDAVLEQSVRRSCSPFWGIPLRQDSARIGVECKKQTGPISRCGYNLTTRKEDTDAIRRTTGLNRVSEVKEELRSGSFGDDKVSVCRTGGPNNRQRQRTRVNEKAPSCNGVPGQPFIVSLPKTWSVRRSSGSSRTNCCATLRCFARHYRRGFLNLLVLSNADHCQ